MSDTTHGSTWAHDASLFPTADDVRAATIRLQGVAVHTPLVRSEALSAQVGVHIYLKCEQAQHTGSFKLRGAFNALATLPEAARVKGIIASSAGNHGLGVAYAARTLKMRARIFIPASASPMKRDGIIALGADVDVTQPDYDSTHHAAESLSRDTGMSFVPPSSGATLLAGQGTVALEVLDDLPDLRTIIVPVGGGGLVGGIAAYLKAVAPHVRIVGVQGEHANAMAASLAAGRRVDVAVPPTLADGLSGQIDDAGYAIGRAAIDEMMIVSEADIAATIAWLAREHQTRVEGSGAVAVAALLYGRVRLPDGPVAVVVTGGNIDTTQWERLVGQHAPTPCA